MIPPESAPPPHPDPSLPPQASSSDTASPPAPDSQPSAIDGLGKAIGCFLLLVVGAFLCFILFAWFMSNSFAQVSFRITEITPADSTPFSHLAQGWPASLHRIIQASSGQGFRGEGTGVTIHCFDPRDVPQVQALIGKGRQWAPGYHSAGHLLREFKGRLPAAVYFDDTTSPDTYLFLQDPDIPQLQHIIDTTHGICYRIFFDT